ncbi:DUF427 domain-containing protein [Candidatus Halocynthiibacter alkanivorans]|uniref:DUF427 domain-containing protein n=1 Tax=Candidatus Halocynthiibacter alkanivorans TaxID=2267619 RepID=UPI000DF2DFC1|nr:DUF427 domain-containing protein [Candidatus Halocynthiibacter alkanivorans]
MPKVSTPLPGDKNSSVALVEGAIRNPANPNHFMVVMPVKQPVQIHINQTLVAETTRALRVIEIGNHAYQPRLYIPESDVTAKLTKVDKTTHCPLKGDATYYAFGGSEVAWRYDTFDFANVLNGHLSFSAPEMRTTEGE